MAERREPGAVSTNSNIHPAQPQSGCRLLLLAPELRNSIYELVFDESSDSPVDLRHTNPPSRALLLTCRAIHAETSLVYRHAYRQYWSTNDFELTLCRYRSEAVLMSINKLAERDCDRMTYVKVVETFGLHDQRRKNAPTWVMGCGKLSGSSTAAQQVNVTTISRIAGNQSRA